MNAELARLEKVLRSRRLRVTRTRRTIFAEILASSDSHLDAREIHDRLRRKGRNVSLATIYRTLQILVRSGLLSREDLGESHSHYEPKTRAAGHGHLICSSCGRVFEFADEGIRKAIAAVGAAEDFRLEKYSLQIFGYCRRCRK